jgi:tRNA(Arg) A34 adenosine deaminase TadA
MGAIVWCGIGRVVFAASVPQIGTSSSLWRVVIS